MKNLYAKAFLSFFLFLSFHFVSAQSCFSPTITSQPVSQVSCIGSSLTLSVGVTGSGLTYQWRRNGVNINGATASSYTIPVVVSGSAGSYTVVVTASCGLTATSSPAVITTAAVTAITVQPGSQTVCPGSNAAFSVTATGAGLSYQWRKDGAPISGAISASYTISNTAAANAGAYDVVVSGTCGVVTSAAATLTLASGSVWTGAASTAWAVAANWCSGVVPTAVSDVVIPAGVPRTPTISTPVDVRGLTILTGGRVSLAAAGRLNLHGFFVNSGTFTATTGTVAFQGAQPQAIGAMTAANVVMNGTGGVVLGGNMVVTTSLTLTSGHLSLGGFNLTLTPSATGSASSHLITNGAGSVIASNVTTTARTVPVGTGASYNPVTITNGQGRAYSVKVQAGINPSIADNSKGVNRTWSVVPNTLPPAPVSLSFGYSDADVNAGGSGAAAMEAGIATGGTWDIITPAGGVAPTGTAAARVVSLSTTRFGTIVLANTGALLPQSVRVTTSVTPSSVLYTSVGAAFAAINSGVHTGAVEVAILSNTVELGSAVLHSSGAGGASYTSVKVYPAADGITLSGAVGAGRGLLELNGADGVTIDGDNPATGGTNRNLTLINTAAVTVNYGSLVRIATDTLGVAAYRSADGIRIQNLNIRGNAVDRNITTATGAGSEGTSFGIYAGGFGGAAMRALTSAGIASLSGTTINDFAVQNCAVTAAAIGIIFNGANATVSNSVTVSGNLIGEQTTALSGMAPFAAPLTTVYVRGVRVGGTNSVVVSGNTVNNIVSYVNASLNGIEVSGAIGAGVITISNNTISGVVQNNTASTLAPKALLLTAATGPYTISGNTITNVQWRGGSTVAAQVVTGLEVSSRAPSATIEANKVSGIYNVSTSTYGAYGINIGGGNSVRLQNNFVSDINHSMTTGAAFNTQYGVFGIRVGAGSGHRIYHNSVHLAGVQFGSPAPSQLSAALGLLAAGGVDVRNNILSNVMTGGALTNAHVSLYLPSRGVASLNLTLNNNAYYSGTNSATQGIAQAGTEAGSGFYGAAGFAAASTAGASNLRSYTATLSATGANDNASLALTTPAPFVGNTNLHLQPSTTPTPLESKGANIGVMTDIDGEGRPGPAGSINGGGISPDLGADEFDGVPLFPCFSPSITSQPLSQVSCIGSSLTLSVGVTGSGLTYQWRRNGVNINGATASSYTIPVVVSGSAGSYTVVVTASCGLTATSSPAVITTAAVTAITVQPGSQTVCPGSNAAFSVTATGAGLSYQWRKDGAPISGAISASYTISNTAAANAGAYDVVVSGTCGVVTSAAATLTLASGSVWTGAASTAWAVAANWCSGVVPTAVSDVVIPAGVPRTPTISTPVDVRGLTILTGGRVSLAAAGRLNLHGFFVNSGTFTATTGTVAFQGAQPQAIGAMTAANVVMNGTGGVVLGGNMVVTTSLTLTSGHLSLGGFNLTLTPSATGSASSHLITNGAGSVIASNVTTTARTVPVGTGASYNPVTITNGQGRAYSVKVQAGINPSIADNSKGVNRTWSVVPNTLPPAPVSLSFGYSDADVNAGGSGAAAMEAGIATGGTWDIITPAGGVAPTGTAAARVVSLSTTRFGTIVLANTGALLPQSVRVTTSVTPSSVLYTSVGAAFAAINSGVHTGAVEVAILSNTVELGSAVLHSSGAGGASYTSVKVYPAADGITLSGAVGAGRGLLELNGADGVTIDGDNPATGGTNRNLTLINTAAVTVNYGSLVRIATDTLGVAAYRSADGIRIQNLNIRGNAVDRNITTATGAGSEGTSFGIYAGGFGGAAMRALTSAGIASLSGTTINDFAVQNCAVTAAAIGIIFNGANATVSNSVTVSGNLIGEQTTALSGMAPFAAPLTTVYVRGVRVGGTNSVVVSGNTVNNIVSYVNASLNGIEVSGAIGAGVITISNNTISGVVQNNTASTLAPKALLLTAATGPYTISGNTITNVQWRGGSTVAAQVVTGLEVSSRAPSATIEANKVSGIYNVSTSTYGAYGINIGGGNSVRLQNNFVSDINHSMTTGAAFNTQYGVFGIRVGAGSGHRIYHNSVHLAGVQFGSPAPSQLSAALGLLAAGGVDVRNNILSNVMTGGALTNAHVSLYLPSRGVASLNLTLNNNAYYSGTNSATQGIAQAGTEAGSGFYGAAGFAAASTAGASNLRSYTATLSATGANDNASLALTTPAPFVGNTNLHLQPSTTPTPLESKGANIGVMTDIDGEARSLQTPDIGADEVACTAIAINIQPVAQSICLDSTARFSVRVTGTNPTYQWRRNGVNIAGATDSIYTVAQAQIPQSGNYDVIVRNVCSSDNSDAVLLTVSGSPVITTQPTSQAACLGANVTLSVVANGPGLAYQWQRNGVPLTGATASSYNINGIAAGDTGNYRVVISSTCGVSQSAIAILSLVGSTTITTQPLSQVACPGSNVTFSVVAAGGGLTYQWRRNGTAIANATSSTYTITNVSAASAGNYDVLIRNACGSQLASTVATLALNTATAITAQPGSQTVCAGSPALFSASATGTNLTYQWRKNNSPISGATGSTYSIAAAMAADAGTYDVVVTGSCGVVTSGGAVLSVNTSNTWTGTVSTNWHLASNWCGGSIPGSTSNVVISAGSPNMPVISATADVRNLTINTGGRLTVEASGRLNFYGDFGNSGLLSANAGTIAFVGSNVQTAPAVAAANIIVNGSGLTLNGDMAVGNTLTLTQGNLTLGAYTITLANSTNGSPSSHIVTNGTGSVIINNVSAATTIPVGPNAASYNPVTITNGQGRNFTVKVSTGILPVAIGNNAKAINRTWSVVPNSIPASSVNLTFGYADTDANAAADPSASMEVGLHNGSAWTVISPSGGLQPTGTATSRQVTLAANSFGNIVVANVGSVQFTTAVPNLDASITSTLLLPNIVSNQALLRIVSNRAMRIDLLVLDMQGRLVRQVDKRLLVGQNDWRFDFSELASGTYQLLGVTPTGRTTIVRFVKL